MVRPNCASCNAPYDEHKSVLGIDGTRGHENGCLAYVGPSHRLKNISVKFLGDELWELAWHERIDGDIYLPREMRVIAPEDTEPAYLFRKVVKHTLKLDKLGNIKVTRK